MTASAVAISGPPALARGVELLGALKGSGYRETPSLARRSDGQMVKLTPLLYELLDAMDGHRGFEELAAELGSRIDRQVAAEDVRYLTERKLAPLGLVGGDDGLRPELAKANPLLALRPRVVITRPALTRILTQPFVWLFKPPVVAALVLAFTAISVWLIGDKGLASSLHQAFYEPGLLLVVWALVVISMAFHEIGHAAACRYGGARPGVMGGGLYLVWPAFYTDVSDAYRLDRRGRLRVDLGGLYFTAIFAVVTFGLWLALDLDALLLIVAVQLIQMVRQLTPFIRADGYHIIADLVGVPDLFAHLKPTLAGLLPTRWRGGQHHALRPWARAAVTAWVLLTVPLLISLLAGAVLTFPRMAATGWDSMQQHWAQGTAAWSGGDLAGAVLGSLSAGLVALPVLGIVFVLWRLGRATVVSVWRKTADRPRLRGLSLVVAAVIVGLVAWAWWPDGSYKPISSGEGGPVPTVLRPPVGDAAIQSIPVGRRAKAPQPRHVLVRPRVATAGVARPGQQRRAAVALSEAVQRKLGAVQEEVQDGPPPQSTALPAATGVPEPLGSLPGPSAEPLSAWPFPFDPPPPTKPGDNRAMAVNAEDGTTKWDFKPSFVTIEGGEPVRHTNDAHAYASCRDCVTGATAFQVILIVGRSAEIAPVNAAAAANYHCVRCHTYAFAYQIVASVTEVTPEVQEALDAAHERLRELEAQASSLTGAEIHAALEEVEHSILESLDDVVAVDSDSDSALPQTSGEGEPTSDPAASSP